MLVSSVVLCCECSRGLNPCAIYSVHIEAFQLHMLVYMYSQRLCKSDCVLLAHVCIRV